MRNNVLTKIRKNAPFSYRTDTRGQRHQNYFSTFICICGMTGILNVIATPFLVRYAERQTLTGIGLIGMASLLGLVSGGIHFAINRRRGMEDRSNYSVQIDNEIELYETTDLLGQNHKRNAVHGMGDFHPRRWVYPPTPIKTACWIPAVALAVLAVTSMIKPDFFNELAGKSPIVNGTYTNCTFSNITITNNTTCVSEVGALLGVVMLTFPIVFPLIFAGIATLLHYTGAKLKAAEPLQKDSEPSENNFSF